MPISRELIRECARSIAATEGLHMDADALLEDVVLLSRSFPSRDDFIAACANTQRAIGFLVAGRVSASALKHGLEGWLSYHYQHKVGQGAKATCRMVYRPVADGIEVKGFGHRSVPADFYLRMSASRE